MMLSPRHRAQPREKLVPLGFVQRAEQQPRTVPPYEELQAFVNLLGVNRNGICAELFDGARKNVGSQARLRRGVDHHQSCVTQRLLDAHLTGGRRKLHPTMRRACLPTLQLSLKASTRQKGRDLDVLRMFDRNDSHPLPPLCRHIHRSTTTNWRFRPTAPRNNAVQPSVACDRRLGAARSLDRCHSCPAPVCVKTRPLTEYQMPCRERHGPEYFAQPSSASQLAMSRPLCPPARDWWKRSRFAAEPVSQCATAARGLRSGRSVLLWAENRRRNFETGVCSRGCCCGRCGWAQRGKQEGPIMPVCFPPFRCRRSACLNWRKRYTICGPRPLCKVEQDCSVRGDDFAGRCGSAVGDAQTAAGSPAAFVEPFEGSLGGLVPERRSPSGWRRLPG